MSIRITLLFVLVIGLSVYAYRDWFKSLCGLILLMAVIQHPDMPKNILGIQGLNPWNVLMFNVVVAWLISRRREGLVWDMPRYVNVMLLLYLGVVLVGFVRMMGDRSHMEELSIGYVVSEYLINSVKWVVPGLLFFDGCRTRRRLAMGIGSILVVYFLLALLVIRWMPASSVLGGGNIYRTRTRIDNEVGYSAVNMSMLLAGASWAIVATLPLWKRRSRQVCIVVAALATLYGQTLTGGRMGYAAWCIVGLLLCLLRWRKYLLLAPVMLAGLLIVFPGAVDRMLHGFGEVDVMGETVTDDYRVTAGRTLAWPYVISRIMDAPILGYGREAMVRTGTRDLIRQEHPGEAFAHPHNAYLQWLLDNGLVGFLLVMPFYGVVVAHAARLFRDRSNPWYAAAGGVTLALVLALLAGAIGSESFYPREGALGMWCAIGLMFRMSLERDRARAALPQAASGPCRPLPASLQPALARR